MSKSVAAREMCLKECTEKGLFLILYPSGTGSRCFYECIVVYQNAELDAVVSRIEEFLLQIKTAVLVLIGR